MQKRPLLYIYKAVQHIEFQVTHLYVQIYNLYLSHRKLYIRNFQPIYNTVQHIFSDTTYILVFNIFVTLGVPYWRLWLRFGLIILSGSYKETFRRGPHNENKFK